MYSLLSNYLPLLLLILSVPLCIDCTRDKKKIEFLSSSPRFLRFLSPWFLFSSKALIQLHGLHKGLEFIVYHRFQNVIEEGKALLICRAFQGHSIFAWNLIPTWNKIVGSMKRISQWSSMYCSRMANTVANALYLNWLLQYTMYVFTNSPPPGINSLHVQKQPSPQEGSE